MPESPIISCYFFIYFYPFLMGSVFTSIFTVLSSTKFVVSLVSDKFDFMSLRLLIGVYLCS